MLSLWTFLKVSAICLARSHARVSRFIRSIARRMYAALDILSTAAHRLLVFKRLPRIVNLLFSVPVTRRSLSNFGNEVHGAGFDRRHHFDAGGQMEIFQGGARDDGGEWEARFEIDAHERSH